MTEYQSKEDCLIDLSSNEVCLARLGFVGDTSCFLLSNFYILEWEHLSYVCLITVLWMYTAYLFHIITARDCTNDNGTLF